MKYVIFILIAITFSSCCVYKSSRTRLGEKISEFGMCGYSNRPISQDDAETTCR